MTNAEEDDDDGSLPFDVELERLPSWVHVASGLVVVVGVLVTAHLVPMLTFLPFLIASSIGRRLLHTTMHVEVGPRGLTLPKREITRNEIVDLWLDSDEAEPRVTIHHTDDAREHERNEVERVRWERTKRDPTRAAHKGARGGARDSKRAELLILYFANRDQAIRFHDVLRSRGDGTSDNDATTVAVGYLPRPVDLLSSLRFIAVGAAFVQTGGWLSLAVFAFGALNAVSFFRAKQVIAGREDVIIRTALSERRHSYADVRSVLVDTGTIALRQENDGNGKEEITISRASIRDGMLASPAWLERSRRRVLKHIREAAASSTSSSSFSSSSSAIDKNKNGQ